MTSLKLLESFPFTSADSTSWIMTGANGSIMSPFGVVYVSGNDTSSPNHIHNINERSLVTFKKYLQSINTDIETLSVSYKERMLANLKYLKNWAYNEVFEGMCYTNDEIADMFNKCFEDTTTGDLVVIENIPVFSYCEHHMALMYDMKVSVGYIPKGKVIGLSKVARIADMCAKRLQLQERIGTDIYEVLKKVLSTEDIIVVIEGSHSCMTARGIKKVGSKTKTACCKGEFMNNTALRQEFYSLIN